MNKVVRSTAQSDRSAQRTDSTIVSMKLYQAGIKGCIDRFTLHERLGHLKKYGNHCMSFSGLQPGMHYYDIPDVGYIAYKNQWGISAVLADPVCKGTDRELLIREFLNTGENIEFVQISEDVADLLHEKFGYYCTQFGIEPVIDLQSWDIKGKKKQVLRTSINHAARQAIVFSEKEDDIGQMQLASEWLRTRKVKDREISFLIRPMRMDFEEGVRKFYASLDGKLIGFIFFDPLYEDGNLVGYTPNISRFNPVFRQGIFYSLMVYAIERFKQEGVTFLHLGLCPLAVKGEDKSCESRAVKKLIRFLYEYGNNIFSFKGLYFTKSRFCGTEHKTFCAHRSHVPLRSIITLFKLSHIM